MNRERDKFLTEAMGLCPQDEGTYRDSGYLCCYKCKELTRICSGTVNFSTWEGFGKLWEWSQQQGWWLRFKTIITNNGPLSCFALEPFINPDRFANALYKYLKERL